MSDKLLAAFAQMISCISLHISTRAANSTIHSMIEPLSHASWKCCASSPRDFRTQEIANRLFLALSTVKGHNLKIFGKLQVQNRTEAVARARELGLL